MRRRGCQVRNGLHATVVLIGLMIAPSAMAADNLVTGGRDALRSAVAAADAGDKITVAAGSYNGPIVIDKPLTIVGRAGAIVDGGGKGRVLTVSAPDVILRELTIRHSGGDLFEMDSGIFVDVDGDRALIEANKLEGNLFGIYLQGPEDAVVRNNHVVGRDDLRMSERGNGVSVWNSPGSQVLGNHFEQGRDGIFVNTSRENSFRDNHFENLRFAIHYMYADDSEVARNVSIGNHVGFALMFSTGLTVHNNISVDDRDRGLLLNYANESEIVGNAVRAGPEKCVFIYNSSKNVFKRNYFEGCEIGVHFTAGSERNSVTENAFIGNRTQVKYVGTQWLEWSVDGRGNYWSDHPGFDLDGDRIAEAPYRPNGVVDRLLWSHPLAKTLVTSPALQFLRWIQAQFPGLHPGGVVDSAPLMLPPVAAGGPG